MEDNSEQSEKDEIDRAVTQMIDILAMALAKKHHARNSAAEKEKSSAS